MLAWLPVTVEPCSPVVRSTAKYNPDTSVQICGSCYCDVHKGGCSIPGWEEWLPLEDVCPSLLIEVNVVMQSLHLGAQIDKASSKQATSWYCFLQQMTASLLVKAVAAWLLCPVAAIFPQLLQNSLQFVQR